VAAVRRAYSLGLGPLSCCLTACRASGEKRALWSTTSQPHPPATPPVRRAPVPPSRCVTTPPH